MPDNLPTALQVKAQEIAKKYESLPMLDKIRIIAQTFNCTSGQIHTSPCRGKWRGTSDIYIRFDNGTTLGVGNELTPKAKTRTVQNKYINVLLARYNPEIVAATKEIALAALRKREAADNAIAAKKGLKPYVLLNVELHDGRGREDGGYIGWYYVTIAVDDVIHAHLETGLSYDIANGKVSEIPSKRSYYAAGALEESDVDYIFNNVGFSSASELYSLPLSDDVLERAKKALEERGKTQVQAHTSAKNLPRRMTAHKRRRSEPGR